MEIYSYQKPIHKYRFSLENTTDINNTLTTKGWVVVSNIATTQQCSDIIDLQWRYLESLGTGLKRDTPRTWYESGRWPGMISNGQVLAPFVGHSEATKKARNLKKVKDLFSKIYKLNESDELISSYDTMNMVRPYTLAVNRTKHLAPHLDQNPYFEEEFTCYQGLLNLIDSNLIDGGTMLLSESHKHFLEYKKYADASRNRQVYIKGKDSKKLIDKMVCPTLKAGDFLLWDSRVIHGVAAPEKGKKDPKGTKHLRRSVVYISMVPSSKVSKEVKDIMKEYLKNKITTNHSVLDPKKKNLRPRYPRKIPYGDIESLYI